MNPTPEAWSTFAVLAAAHVAGDFLLQSARDVANRRRPLVLLRHALVHAALAYLVIGAWSCWPVPVAVFVTHALIDALKDRRRDTARAFVIDQCTHLAVLFALALWLAGPGACGGGWLDRFGREYPRLMLLAGGFVAVVEAGAHLVAKLVRPYLEELERTLAGAPVRPVRGLTNAGKVIGRLERTLVFLLVLVDQAAGIGFLIAAKSIFRFGELKDTANRMESEYIIIGTLASFAYAIAVTYAVVALARVVG